MRLLLKMAWRNVWRNKRRSVITIAAVTFAVMLAVAQRGMQLGTYEKNIQQLVRLSSGYLQVQAPGYQENPTLRRSFAYDRRIVDILRADPAINGFGPRVYADALLSKGDNSFGAMLVGLDPESEGQVSDFPKKVRRGRFIQPGLHYEVDVGEKLLKNLGADIGDSVVVLVQGYDGFLRDAYVKIVGAVKTGSPDLDRAALFMPLPAAQDLLGMENRVSVVAISLYRLKDLEKVRDRLQAKLDALNLRVLTWGEVMPSIKQSIEFDNVGGLLFLAILVVVVAFGILNTMLMSVTERFREFGVVLALGMPPWRLVLVVFYELMMILLIGMAVGNLLAAGINSYIIHHPIFLGARLEDLYAEFGFLPYLWSSLDWRIFFNNTVTILIVGLIASAYPLWKVYHLEPLRGIRYT